MPTEYEAKVLDIDPTVIADLIIDKGGKRLSDALMRRYVYDITPGDQTTWIRLRDTGDQATLTVKEVTHDGIDGTYEVETTVGDFDTANELLGKLGYTPKSYQETHRTSFLLDDARLEIDQWPKIPPYLEIESNSHAHVLQVADLLGYAEDQLTGENTITIYARHNIDLDTIPELRFE